MRELVADMRKLFMPHTATKLRETKCVPACGTWAHAFDFRTLFPGALPRRSNSLKDFVSVAGMLHVTHFLMLRERSTGVNLRIMRVPRGPTLTFRVRRFVRCRDVLSAQKRPADVAQAYRFPPLVVLNGFSAGGSMGVEGAPGSTTDAGALALQTMQATLQGMFPTINVRTVALKQCRRVVLFHRDKDSGLVEMRHFLIRANPVGASRAVRKLGRSNVPNLGALGDVADFVLSGGRTGGGDGYATSDSEFEDEAGRVTLPAAFAGKGNKAATRSAVKLTELGPRLSLELHKIEAGLDEGEVLYNARVHKSPEEVLAMAQRHAVAATVKAARVAEQAEHVAAKEAKREAKRAAKKARRAERMAALEEVLAAGGPEGYAAEDEEGGSGSESPHSAGGSEQGADSAGEDSSDDEGGLGEDWQAQLEGGSSDSDSAAVQSGRGTKRAAAAAPPAPVQGKRQAVPSASGTPSRAKARAVPLGKVLRRRRK